MKDKIPELVGANYPVFAKLDSLQKVSGVSVKKLHHVASWLLHWHRLNSSDATGLAVFEEIERIIDDK